MRSLSRSAGTRGVCIGLLFLIIPGGLLATESSDRGGHGASWSSVNLLTSSSEQEPPYAPLAVPEHQSITQYDGPQTCIACHQTEAEEMHGTVHYQQAGPTPNVLNIPGLAGERGAEDIGMNTYCGTHVTSRRSICAGCHVGNGQFPSPDVSQAQLENIDCMLCHQDAYQRKAAGPFEDLAAIGADGQPKTVQAPIEDENGFFYAPDEAAMSIILLEAARTVHLPTRASCLRCHAKAGGADGAKRGDISSALVDPTPQLDVHMGSATVGLTCSDCHAAGGHRVRGRGLDLRPNDVAERLTCDGCHGGQPHSDYLASDGARLDTHALRVACQSCHIPHYGVGVSTEIDRDWTNPQYSALACSGQGGWKPEEIHASDLVPSYRWFDGRSEVYVLGEVSRTNADGEVVFAAPVSGVASPASKLYPMKEHRSNSARHDATGQMIPHSTGTFFRTGDFDQAVQEGMAQAGLEGDYSVVRVHTFQTINHGVAEDGQLQCGACHDDPAYVGGPPRVDLQAELGYGLKGPATQVCAQCHEYESPGGFKSTHDRHVKNYGYDCSTCHEFSRPQRALDYPYTVDNTTTIQLDRLGSGALVSWSAAPQGLSYDLVRGSLKDLRDTAGDFLFATGDCMADDAPYLSLADHDTVSAGDGYWYLGRAILVTGPASYESGGDGQRAPRDLGIADSPNACP